MKFLRLLIIPLFPLILEGCTKQEKLHPSNNHATNVKSTTTLAVELKPIETHEIPALVTKNIEADLIFSNLKLVEANMLKLRSKVYYDLKFVDDEQFAITATFDEHGNIISN
ncbi:hypothetical protein KZP23_22820 [Echinicola marina]|uniref:hypothetical protein n=1 Tax=Echinicola marina TaxID=2859768 RepID=UPI001CF64C1D|nr:hypothetical protein [Echinicola marina]UCS93436.1 hypothetical protein KZP23_22820 [Echinicola marina]